MRRALRARGHFVPRYSVSAATKLPALHNDAPVHSARGPRGRQERGGAHRAPRGRRVPAHVRDRCAEGSEGWRRCDPEALPRCPSFVHSRSGDGEARPARQGLEARGAGCPCAGTLACGAHRRGRRDCARQGGGLPRLRRPD